MMLPTHVVVGLAVATPLSLAAPEFAPAVLLGGALGSAFPDLDMYAGHRRTLHFPTGYLLLAVLAVGGAALVGTPAAAGVALFAVGAALHCQMDRLGGGLELQPWEERSERAVYDHVRGRWHRPRRWIRYDGAPEDALAAFALGVPLLVVLDGPFRWVVATALVVAAVYAALRRRLAELAPAVFSRVPDPAAAYVPDRYRE